MDAALTLAEAAQVLDPPITERDLRAIVAALHWEPAEVRRNGHSGRPPAAYNATRLMRLHAALVPFMDAPQVTAGDLAG
jgi:hypothetical protein